MRFDWDEKKRKDHIRKHGFDFADAMTDEKIDTSDIPPLSDELFAKAKWRIPRPPVAVTVHVEPEVLEWFKTQGEDFGRRMSAALRIYVEAHKELVSQAPQ